MPRISRLILAGWLGGLLLLSHARIGVWRSDVALWTATVASDPLILRPRVNLASALMTVDQAAAVEQWQAAETIIDRAEGLPWPPSMRREVALNLAALSTVRDPAVSVETILAWGGCQPREATWACPPN